MLPLQHGEYWRHRCCEFSKIDSDMLPSITNAQDMHIQAKKNEKVSIFLKDFGLLVTRGEVRLYSNLPHASLLKRHVHNSGMIGPEFEKAL